MKVRITKGEDGKRSYIAEAWGKDRPKLVLIQDVPAERRAEAKAALLTEIAKDLPAPIQLKLPVLDTSPG